MRGLRLACISKLRSYTPAPAVDYFNSIFFGATPFGKGTLIYRPSRGP